jgi:anti-anti-sigma factor
MGVATIESFPEVEDRTGISCLLDWVMEPPILEFEGLNQTMKTQYRKVGDTLVVSVDGKLSFDNQDAIKLELARLARSIEQEAAQPNDSAATKIVFDLGGLEFVGSSGISNFVQTLKEFTLRSPIKPTYTNVGTEFRRVMQALDDSKLFDFHDVEQRARSQRRRYDH